MSQAQAGDATGAAPDWWAAPAAASGHTLARGRRAGPKPAKRQSSSCVPAAAARRRTCRGRAYRSLPRTYRKSTLYSSSVSACATDTKTKHKSQNSTTHKTHDTEVRTQKQKRETQNTKHSIILLVSINQSR